MVGYRVEPDPSEGGLSTELSPKFNTSGKMVGLSGFEPPTHPDQGALTN